MLGYASERNLATFLAAVGDGERGLEAARQRLCRIADFAPRSAFDRIDRNGSLLVDAFEICNFLRE